MRAQTTEQTLKARLAGLGRDSLVKNAFFIAASNASMGVLGFLFWLIAARLYPPREIGVATTLVSAAILIGYASQLGFNNSFVRFLPESRERDTEISTGLALVFMAALVIGGLYMALAPLFVPQLGFLRSPLKAGLVVVFIAFGSVNVVTDSVFIAYRSAFYNLVVDGILQGLIRLSVPGLVVGLGAFGLFSAYGLASTAAVCASVVLMTWRFGYRLRPVVSLRVLRKVFRFGAANYLAGLLSGLPTLVLPVIVVRRDGAAAAGFFYLAMQLASLLFNASLAAGQSLFAEGSNQTAPLRHLGARSLRLQVFVLVPLAALIALGGQRILTVFGAAYASHATLTLAVLAASTPGVILKHWTTALLRIRHRLVPLVWSNAVLAALTCGLAVLWSGRGIVWVALAWLIGNLLAGVAGGLPLLLRERTALQAGRPTTLAMAERSAP